MKLPGKNAYDALAMRFGVWNRERRERAQERRAAAPILTGFDRNPARLRFVVWLATFGVIGFLILWVMQITGEVKLDWHVDMAWDRPWRFEYDFIGRFNVLPLIVLFVVSFAIVFWTKAWISLFASTPWRDWFTKWSCLVLGIGGSVAIILGAFEVNQNTRQEDFRGALVTEQTATQGRAALQAQLDSIDNRLTAMRDQSRVGVYAAIAASVGAVAYDSDYLSDEAMARTPAERRDIVRRARGAAVAADTLERDRLALVGQLATATPVAATQAVVEMTDPVSRFIGGIGPWRIVILVVVGDLLLLLGNYYADRAEERTRYARSPQASGWATDAERIEDLRAEEPVAAKSMMPAKEKMYDAETGEELVYRKATYAKKPLRKGVSEPVEFTPDAPADEVGVEVDGGERQAVSAATEGEAQQPEELSEQNAEQRADEKPGEEISLTPQVEPPSEVTLTDDDRDALNALEPEQADEPAQGEQDETTEEPRNPETRDERLLEPPVAAE